MAKDNINGIREKCFIKSGSPRFTPSPVLENLPDGGAAGHFGDGGGGSAIPTAVLSTHTAVFRATPSGTYEDILPSSALAVAGLTPMRSIRLLGSIRQIGIVRSLPGAESEDTLLIVDPVMADNESSTRTSPRLPVGMRALCAEADVIPPTYRAALILGEPYMPAPATGRP
jgi:hypothetical protein